MLSFEDVIYHFTVEYEKRLHDYKKNSSLNPMLHGYLKMQTL